MLDTMTYRNSIDQAIFQIEIQAPGIEIPNIIRNFFTNADQKVERLIWELIVEANNLEEIELLAPEGKVIDLNIRYKGKVIEKIKSFPETPETIEFTKLVERESRLKSHTRPF